MRILFALVAMLLLLGCVNRPKDETADLSFTKGWKVIKRSTDSAGDDAGYVTTFDTPESYQQALDKAKVELTAEKGWTMTRDPARGRSTFFRMERDGMKFEVEVFESRGVAVRVRQRVPEDRM